MNEHYNCGSLYSIFHWIFRSSSSHLLFHCLSISWGSSRLWYQFTYKSKFPVCWFSYTPRLIDCHTGRRPANRKEVSATTARYSGSTFTLLKNGDIGSTLRDRNLICTLVMILQQQRFPSNLLRPTPFSRTECSWGKTAIMHFHWFHHYQKNFPNWCQAAEFHQTVPTNDFMVSYIKILSYR